MIYNTEHQVTKFLELFNNLLSSLNKLLYLHFAAVDESCNNRKN